MYNNYTKYICFPENNPLNLLIKKKKKIHVFNTVLRANKRTLGEVYTLDAPSSFLFLDENICYLRSF